MYNISKEGMFFMLQRDRKYLIGLKVLATIALVCTVVLWCGLWGASATPNDKSKENTQDATDRINEKYGLSAKFAEKLVTQKIYVSRGGTGYLYANDTEKLRLWYEPAETLDKDVRFRSTNPEIISVDENGVITCHKKGEASIVATLKSNESIHDLVTIGCYGEFPEDTKNALGDLKLQVGTSSLAILNDGKLDTSVATYEVDNENVVVHQDRFFALKEGTTTVTATFKKNNEQATATITVEKNESFQPPTNIVFKNNGNPTFTYGVISRPIDSIIEKVEPMGSFGDFIVTSDNPSVVRVNYGYLAIVDVGTAKLTYTSPYNDHSQTVTVNVKYPQPTGIDIVGPDVISPNTSFKYRAVHSPWAFSSQATWEVVGKKATITEDGWLKTKRFGKVVIRCTSTIDPSFSQEKTVEVKLFSDSYEFVRKFLGHGGLSALLGFGIFGTLFLLCKPKWLCAVLTPPLALIFAGVSEGIQYFAPGRTCSIADILTDFIGALVGMVVAGLLIAIVLGIWRLVNKESFIRFVRAYNFLSFRTLFKRIPVLDEEEAPAQESEIE